MAQRPATNIEPFAYGVQAAALVLAFAAMREHEPCRTKQATWQWVPAIEIESAVAEHLGRDTVGDEAEVVLGQRKDGIRKYRIQLLPQILHVEFVQGTIT